MLRMFHSEHTKGIYLNTTIISGMFCYYNQAMYHTLMYTLAITNGCKVILCGQKLAPEFPFPNAVIEAYQVKYPFILDSNVNA